MTATLLGVVCPDQVVETRSDQGEDLGAAKEEANQPIY